MFTIPSDRKLLLVCRSTRSLLESATPFDVPCDGKTYHGDTRVTFALQIKPLPLRVITHSQHEPFLFLVVLSFYIKGEASGSHS